MGGHQRKQINLPGFVGWHAFPKSTIEVMDGFSEGWGFSLTDMSANVAGLSCFIFNKNIGASSELPSKKAVGL